MLGEERDSRKAMKSKTVLLGRALASVVAYSGSAQEPITVVGLIDHLDKAAGYCDWKAHKPTGAPKLRMLLHEPTMDDLLAALRARREVDSSKLDEALKNHPL